MAEVVIPNWLKRLRLAPIYHPTETEFTDPIAYISKIEKEASSYGICKIVPPLPKPSKRYVFSNLNKSLEKSREIDGARSPAGRNSGDAEVTRAVFTTRNQELGCPSSRKTKGQNQWPVQKQVWQSGKMYTLEQFESKSRNFARSQLGMLKDVSPLVLETLFWQTASEKPIYIEYANDVPGSGFGEPEDTLFYMYRGSKRRKLNQKHVRAADKKEEKLHDENSSVKTENTCFVLSLEVDNEVGISEPLESSHGMPPRIADEQEDMHEAINSNSSMERTAGWRLSNSPWNLQVIARSPGSLTRYMPDEVPGVTSPMVYIGMLFSWFAWHVEDHELHSLNFLHTGSPKTWYAVPGSSASTFEEVIRVHGYDGELSPAAAFAVLGEKTTLLSPEVAVASGIPCCRLVQYPGEFVVTFPRAYHVGFSHGFNCGEAANFATTQWLNVAKEAAIRRAAMNYLPMLSHQQLLYMLALSFVSRVPGAISEDARSSRCQDRKREREMEVKRAFIVDVKAERMLLDALIRKTSVCAVLWNPEILPSSSCQSLSHVEEPDRSVREQTFAVIPCVSCRGNSLGHRESDISLQDLPADQPIVPAHNSTADIISVQCGEEKNISCACSVGSVHNDSLHDYFASSGLNLDSGALACVACGILGFPCMAIIQPSDKAVKDLFPDLEKESFQQVSVSGSMELDDLQEASAAPKPLEAASKETRPGSLQSVGCESVSTIPFSDTKEAVPENNCDFMSSSDIHKAHAVDASSETLHRERHDVKLATDSSNSGNHSSYHILDASIGNLGSHHQEGSYLTTTSVKDNINVYSRIEDMGSHRLQDKPVKIVVEDLKGHDSQTNEELEGPDIQSSLKETIPNACFKVNNTPADISMKMDKFVNNFMKKAECHKSLSETQPKVGYVWNPSKKFLRPRVFCLEHALKVEEVLKKKGGANVLVICHSDYPKIVEGAAIFAKEVGADFYSKDIPIVNASNADLDLINCSVDDELKESCEDWSSRLGFNLQHYCRLNKQQVLSGQELPPFSLNGLFTDSLETYASSKAILNTAAHPCYAFLKWHIQKSRSSHQRRNTSKKFDAANLSSKSNGSLHVKPHAEACIKCPVLQYSRRNKNGKGPNRPWNLDLALEEPTREEHGNWCMVEGATEATDVRTDASSDIIDKEQTCLVALHSTACLLTEMSEQVNNTIENALLSKGSAGIMREVDTIQKREDEACVSTGVSTPKRIKVCKSVEETIERSEVMQFIRSPCEGLRSRQSSGYGAKDITINKQSITRKRPQRKVTDKYEDKNLHRCSIEGCRMSFRRRAELLLHQRNRCTFNGCRKRFSSHKYMLKHQRVHEEERPLKCPWKGCRMSFKWAWARTEHLRVHTGERPYVCKYKDCGQTFRFVSDFSRHKRKTEHWQ